MSDTQLFSVIGGLFVIIFSLIAWIANAVVGRLGDIQGSIDRIELAMISLVERVAKVESRCDVLHCITPRKL